MKSLFNDQLPTIFNDLFGEDNHYFPNYKILKEKDSIKLMFTVPGLDKDDINIKVIDDEIIISYNKENDSDGYRFVNSFKKRFTLVDIDIDNIKAEVDKGILEINLPYKMKKDKEKIIEIL